MDVTGRDLDDTDMRSGRIDALSDGVFGVALTLLVLDLKIPDARHLTHTQLAQQLTGLIP